MKSVLTPAICLFVLGLSAKPAAAQRFDFEAERPTPSIGVIAGGGIQASPLVRYLAATLQLSQEQTLAVQQAVQKHQRRTRTPALLTECLEKVLPTPEFNRYLALQRDAVAAKNLRVLAVR